MSTTGAMVGRPWAQSKQRSVAFIKRSKGQPKERTSAKTVTRRCHVKGIREQRRKFLSLRCFSSS